MRLSSIVLHGFKSFVNRTDVPLSTGITGIVGPNGCGKSNVSDAIRWVLGEGNIRHLRGENILDVIFKGAGSTKPAGFAEVTLLIQNDDRSLDLDQAEVAIARRVYRSGDSDFLINNIPCRLKDIKNLFLGTGLGSSGYSVIEREMVDSVLSDRDEQRRLFFEEAAGISRYKVQRKEALRKLEATDLDLTRIADIVREIEREVRSLARQVGKARKHERVVHQIRDLEVRLALDQWRDLDARLHDCSTDRDAGASDRERLSQDLTVREAELETMKLRLLDRERLLEESRTAREDLALEHSAAREEISVLAARVQGGTERQAELARRIEEESARESALRQKIAECEPERIRWEGELDLNRERLAAAERRFQETELTLRQAREKAAATAQVQMRHLLAHAKETQELETLGEEIARLTERSAKLESHRAELSAKTEEAASLLTGLDTETAELERRLAEVVASRAEVEENLARAQTDREELRQLREDLARRRTSLESRLNLLREQKSRHEGFDVGVRMLLERRAAFPEIHGVVGELLSAAPGLAATTAEALLADAVQWVVVEDEESCDRCLEFLEQEGLGGVTFFPLRENRSRFGAVEKEWGTELPIHGPALLAPLVRCLLARVRPAGDRAEARERALQAEALLRHLTPEGEVFSSEGWIRVPGSSGSDREIIERMREIPRLEEACGRIEAEEREAAEKLAARDADLDGLKGRQKSLEVDRENLQENHRRAERDRSERRVERGLLLEELARAEEEIRHLREESRTREGARSDLESRLGTTGETEREAAETHRAAKEQEEETAGLRDSALEALSAARTEAVRIENQLREITGNTTRDVEEADRLAAALHLWGQERADSIEQTTAWRQRLADLEARLGEIEAQREDLERVYGQRRGERDLGQTLLAVHEQQARELRSELHGLQERLHNEQVRELTIRSEMDRLSERIQQEFRVDLAAAAASAAEGSVEQPPFDPEQARQQAAELRTKLLDLGPVNFMAAEEYDRQKERLLFHRRHQEDLTKAKTDLMTAIQQINETAGVMFRETFDQARVHFRETFQFLFPGGEADITLVGDDPLEGSIEITARPRGKKLEAVRLLSTGERSLTAIALLFGIYLVKPSPFCILDEVDAPLDDANIGRFVTLLRHFSEKTQFVVITHNKRTMEAADRLYGVTMQEVGVSKIVSVRLSEADLELTPAAAQVLEASQSIGGEEA